MQALAWIELALVVVLGTAGQLALKYALRPGTSQGTLLRRLLSPPMLTFLLCYAVSTLIWLLALRTIPLSQAFPIIGLQYALIPLAASRLLNERIAPSQWIGVAVITTGVALVGQS